jgi:hypothetical protein
VPVDAEPPALAPDETFEGAAWSGGILEGVDAEDSTFLECTLADLTVAEGNWERTSWRGGGVAGVRVLGGRFARSRWRGVRFERTALSGCELLGAQLRDVRVEAGMLDAVNLRGATLQDVAFSDCVLRDVDLGGAKLAGVSFSGCRIERLDLSKATLTRVDLRGATFTLARGDPRRRAGARAGARAGRPAGDRRPPPLALTLPNHLRPPPPTPLADHAIRSDHAVRPIMESVRIGRSAACPRVSWGSSAGGRRSR